uniref:Uncharacterized protein n=1 Tax=Quercus lobata TaxID=97700 RepID=A0A7N2KN18_QUELO
MEGHSDSTQRPNSDNNNNNSNNNDQRVYFVPYRWWKDAQDSMRVDSDSDSRLDSESNKGVVYSASPASSYAGPMKLINNIFSLDLVFNLRREEGSDSVHRENGEVGVSGRDYALVPGQMWVQALRWHSDSKVAMKNGKSFLASEDDITDVYPLKLRLSVLRETNSLGVRICKKVSLFN